MKKKKVIVQTTSLEQGKLDQITILRECKKLVVKFGVVKNSSLKMDGFYVFCSSVLVQKL